jgi:hypothetical protein
VEAWKMNFTTLSISIGVVMFCLAFNVSNAITYDLSRNPQSNMYGFSPVNVINVPKNYTDVALSPDPAQFNASNLMEGKSAEMQQYGGYYGFTGISMAQILWDTFMKSSFDLGSFIRYLLNIQDSASAAYALSILVQWGIILNHMFVIIQLVFRPMGFEL